MPCSHLSPHRSSAHAHVPSGLQVLVPGGPWRELPFEPWTVGDRTFVTMQRFGVQSYFRLRLDLEGN